MSTGSSIARFRLVGRKRREDGGLGQRHEASGPRFADRIVQGLQTDDLDGKLRASPARNPTGSSSVLGVTVPSALAMSHVSLASRRHDSRRAASVSCVDPDAHLVRATIGGDLHAFERLIDRHRDVVLRVAGRIAGPAEAEDVSQDAFLRAFHRLPRFRFQAPFRAWLLQITHNAAIDAVTRRRPEPVDPSEAPEPASNGERTPAERLERRERQERLQTKLQLLPPAHRAVLVLRDLEGLTYEEIAEVTSSPLGTVKGRLYRARSEMIDILRANTYDWELPQ